LKTGAGEAVAKIQGCTAQIRRALVVDEKLDPVALDDRVSGFFFIQRHLVMQTGTTTFANLHPQTFSGGLLLRIKEMSELPCCVLGDGNHRPANYDLSSLKSKDRPQTIEALRG